MTRNSWELTDAYLDSKKAAMNKTKCEEWNRYVLAVLPGLVAHFGGEGAAMSVSLADSLVKAREERFGNVAFVGGRSDELPLETGETAANVEVRGQILDALGEEGNELGMRGPEIARRFRGGVEAEVIYGQLEGMVKEGLLALELDRVRDKTFGREQMANVVSYLRLDRVKEVDPEFAAAIEAAGGVLVRPEYDQKKMPAWVRQLRGNIAAVRGGAK